MRSRPERQSRTPRVAAALASALVLGLPACASTSPKRAFDDTAGLVESRTGRRITWNRGTSEDAAVAKHVSDLLSRELTVDAAVEVALLNNPSLQATYEDLSVAQADLVQAGLLQNPIFGAGVAIPVAGAAETGVTLSVSQDFLSVFTLAARKKVAKAELRATELRVADAVLRMTYDVQAAYYALAAAQQLVAMRRTILTTSDATVDLVRRQHDAGNVSDLDLANQDALAEEVRIDVARSEMDVVTAREALARWLGAWDTNLAQLVPAKLPELPRKEPATDDLESLALHRRLDLGAARADREAAEHALSLGQSFRWLGATSAGATYERAPEGFTVVGPNVGLELPLFDQKQAVVGRLEARVNAARAHERAIAGAVRSEVRVATARLALARALVDRYAKVVVPLRERVVALSQEHYNAMLLGTAQLVQAKESEVSAYGELIVALRDYWTARADLERATGGALPTKTTNASGARRGP